MPLKCLDSRSYVMFFFDCPLLCWPKVSGVCMCRPYVRAHVLTPIGNSVVIVRQWRITCSNLASLITHSAQEIFQKLDMCSNCTGIIVSTNGCLRTPSHTYTHTYSIHTLKPPPKKAGGGLSLLHRNDPSSTSSSWDASALHQSLGDCVLCCGSA